MKVFCILKVKVVDICLNHRPGPYDPHGSVAKTELLMCLSLGGRKSAISGHFAKYIGKLKGFDKTIKKFHFANKYKSM